MNERLLLFRHADQHFTLPARVGREAFIPPHIMPLPGAQDALLGLTEVRGLAVPLLNLSALTGTVTPLQLPSLALLLDVGGELLALPAQNVIGLMMLTTDVQTTDLQTTGLLSEPFQAGDLMARHLNPSALVDAACAQLTTA